MILREKTIVELPTCETQETSYFTEVYGDVTLYGADASPGTVIQAVSPRGETVGCFIVNSMGEYGLMRIYGEEIVFTVNGLLVEPAAPLIWADDKTPYAGTFNLY